MEQGIIDTGRLIEPWSGEVLALAEELREDLIATRKLYEELSGKSAAAFLRSR